MFCQQKGRKKTKGQDFVGIDKRISGVMDHRPCADSQERAGKLASLKGWATFAVEIKNSKNLIGHLVYHRDFALNDYLVLIIILLLLVLY